MKKKYANEGRGAKRRAQNFSKPQSLKKYEGKYAENMKKYEGNMREMMQKMLLYIWILGLGKIPGPISYM